MAWIRRDTTSNGLKSLYHADSNKRAKEHNKSVDLLDTSTIRTTKNSYNKSENDFHFLIVYKTTSGKMLILGFVLGFIAILMSLMCLTAFFCWLQNKNTSNDENDNPMEITEMDQMWIPASSLAAADFEYVNAQSNLTDSNS